MHNPDAYHRLTLWDNSIRPNVGPLYGPEASGSMGMGKIGEGKYVSPHRTGTNHRFSYLWATEITVISNYVNDVTKRNETELTVGDVLELDFKDFDFPRSIRVVIESRPLANPVCIPGSDNSRFAGC